MRALFVYNQSSGKGKYKKRFSLIEKELASTFEEMLFLCPESQDEAKDIYRNKSKEYDALIVIGGDGSLNVAINQIMLLEKKPILGYINAGTLGDGGRIFGVNKNLRKSLAIIKKQKITKIDIGKVTDSEKNYYFLYCLAFGAYSSLSYTVKQKSKRRIGHLSYYLHSCNELFKPIKNEFEISVSGQKYSYTSPFVLFLNGERMGGFKLNKGSKINDGLIEAYFPKCSLFNGVLRFLPKKKEKSISVSEIEISPYKNDYWCLDGEKGPFGKVKISVVPSSISIFSC